MRAGFMSNAYQYRHRDTSPMSIESLIEAESASHDGGCSAIEHLIVPRDHDLGDFSVRRALPVRRHRQIGPWIFFDHLGPVAFAAGHGIDVRPHPHINLATVTYLFEGEMLHRDSLGNEQIIRPGEINLMVAGRGIVHSERQRDSVKAVPHRLHALQLWLALPEADEEMAAEFHHYGADDIPRHSVDGVPLRVMMGNAYGLQSPVRTFAETLYVEAQLQAGQSLTLPDGIDERAVYVVSGQMQAMNTVIDEQVMAVMTAVKDLPLHANRDSRLVIIGGERLPPRHIWWNFASSRKQRIEQAKDDWRNGRFPTVPGDDSEYIPMPE